MKPKYHFFKNTKYAIEGIWSLIKNETSFCIELGIIIPAIIISFFLPISLLEHLILIFVLILILIIEALNSAIESCVDLTTDKWHEKAKMAKDYGSSAVFFSIVLALFTWGIILGHLYL